MKFERKKTEGGRDEEGGEEEVSLRRIGLGSERGDEGKESEGNVITVNCIQVR